MLKFDTQKLLQFEAISCKMTKRIFIFSNNEQNQLNDDTNDNLSFHMGETPILAKQQCGFYVPRYNIKYKSKSQSFELLKQILCLIL